MPSVIVPIVAVAIAACAAITDVRSRRIPNVLTLGGAAAALTYHLVAAGAPGLSTAALGWVAGLALFMPLFLLGGMGAGDVKLLAALGAWLGAGDALRLAIFTSLAGGVMALAVAGARGYLGSAFRNVGNLLVFWWLSGPVPMPGMTLEQSAGPRLAYALPICVGTVLTLWLH